MPWLNWVIDLLKPSLQTRTHTFQHGKVKSHRHGVFSSQTRHRHHRLAWLSHTVTPAHSHPNNWIQNTRTNPGRDICLELFVCLGCFFVCLGCCSWVCMGLPGFAYGVAVRNCLPGSACICLGLYGSACVCLCCCSEKYLNNIACSTSRRHESATWRLISRWVGTGTIKAGERITPQRNRRCVAHRVDLSCTPLGVQYMRVRTFITAETRHLLVFLSVWIKLEGSASRVVPNFWREAVECHCTGTSMRISL